jgi:epoxyqueuosine reductase
MSTVTDNLAIAAQVKAKGRELGFDLVGIARADTMRFGRYFRRWLDDGRAGEMEYLARRVDERTDPANYLPGAVSAICVAMNYHSSLEPLPEAETARHGRVARYALGDDYHELIKHRLYDLADWLRETVPGAQTRASVDTALSWSASWRPAPASAGSARTPASSTLRSAPGCCSARC